MTALADMHTESKAEAVERIFMDCLFRSEELVDGKPVGIEPLIPETNMVHPVGFHPERIEQHRYEIKALLDGFHESFYSDGGGGWSFLNFCHLADGTLWTGLHLRMEQLCQLGGAVGLVSFQLPREMWSALPGGMPYLVIKRGVSS